MAGDGALDLGGRVLVDLETLPGRHSQQSSTGLGENDECAAVQTVKGGLQNRDLRLPLPDQSSQLSGQIGKPVGYGLRCRTREPAVGDRA